MPAARCGRNSAAAMARCCLSILPEGSFFLGGRQDFLLKDEARPGQDEKGKDVHQPARGELPDDRSRADQASENGYRRIHDQRCDYRADYASGHGNKKSGVGVAQGKEVARPESQVHPSDKTAEGKGKALGKYCQDSPETTHPDGNDQLQPVRMIGEEYRRYFHPDKKSGNAEKKPEKLPSEQKQDGACGYVVYLHGYTVTTVAAGRGDYLRQGCRRRR